jgi:hypothetical protein
MERTDSFRLFKTFEQKQSDKIEELEEYHIKINKLLIENVKAYENAIVDMEGVDILVAERDRLEREKIVVLDQLKLLRHRRKTSRKIVGLATQAVGDLRKEISRGNYDYADVLSKLDAMKAAYLDTISRELKPIMGRLAELRRRAMEASQYVRDFEGQILFIQTAIDSVQPSRGIGPFFFNNDQIALSVLGYEGVRDI